MTESRIGVFRLNRYAIGYEDSFIFVVAFVIVITVVIVNQIVGLPGYSSYFCQF